MSLKLYFSSTEDLSAYSVSNGFWTYTGSSSPRYNVVSGNALNVDMEKLSFHPVGTGNDNNTRIINANFIYDKKFFVSGTGSSNIGVSGIKGVFFSKGPTGINTGHVDSILIKATKADGSLRGIFYSGDGSQKYSNTGYQALSFSGQTKAVSVFSGDSLVLEIGCKVIHPYSHPLGSSPRSKFVNISGNADCPFDPVNKFLYPISGYNNWINMEATMFFK